MDAGTMLETSVALFATAAAGGLLMAGIRFTRKVNPPAWLAVAHGLLASAGLTLLVFAACTTAIPRLAQIAVVLLLLAATGGLVMNLGYQWKRELLPKTLLAGHALIAVIGLSLLVVATYGSGSLA